MHVDYKNLNFIQLSKTHNVLFLTTSRQESIVFPDGDFDDIITCCPNDPHKVVLMAYAKDKNCFLSEYFLHYLKFSIMFSKYPTTEWKLTYKKIGLLNLPYPRLLMLSTLEADMKRIIQ